MPIQYQHEFDCSVACLDEHNCWKCEMPANDLWTYGENAVDLYSPQGSNERYVVSNASVMYSQDGQTPFRELPICKAYKGCQLGIMFEDDSDLMIFTSSSREEYSVSVDGRILKKYGHDWFQTDNLVEYVIVNVGEPLYFGKKIFLPSWNWTYGEDRSMKPPIYWDRDSKSIEFLDVGDLQPELRYEWHGGIVHEGHAYLAGTHGQILEIDQEDNVSLHQVDNGNIKSITLTNGKLHAWGASLAVRHENGNWEPNFAHMIVDQHHLYHSFKDVAGLSPRHLYFLLHKGVDTRADELKIYELDDCRFREIANPFKPFHAGYSYTYYGEQNLFDASANGFTRLLFVAGGQLFEWDGNKWTTKIMPSAIYGIFQYHSKNYAYFHHDKNTTSFKCLDPGCIDELPSIPATLKLAAERNSNYLWMSDTEEALFRISKTTWKRINLPKPDVHKDSLKLTECLEATRDGCFVGMQNQILSVSNSGKIEQLGDIEKRHKKDIKKTISILTVISHYVPSVWYTATAIFIPIVSIVGMASNGS